MSQTPQKKPRKESGHDNLEPDIIRGARNNDISEVRAALELNAEDINKADYAFGLTALHYAAAKGNPSMVDFLLLQNGVDITIKDRWGRDALDAAIDAGNQDCIDKLFVFRSHLSHAP